MPFVEFEDEISGAIPSAWIGSGRSTGRMPGKALVRYEAPPDPDGLGRSALGYLKPSGQVHFVHPGTGEKFYLSDQKWVYDLAEALELEKTVPERFFRVKG
jgi:hypothetical protein